MTIQQCRDGFRDARVARLATVSAAGVPHLVPVTFAVLSTAPASGGDPAGAPVDGPGEVIVFAVDHKPKSTIALRRLDNIAANPGVAFLVDHYDDDWDRLWWVRADAVAGILDQSDRRRAIVALQEKYPQYQLVAPHGVVVGAVVASWSGWRSAQHDA